MRLQERPTLAEDCYSQAKSPFKTERGSRTIQGAKDEQQQKKKQDACLSPSQKQQSHKTYNLRPDTRNGTEFLLLLSFTAGWLMMIMIVRRILLVLLLLGHMNQK